MSKGTFELLLIENPLQDPLSDRGQECNAGELCARRSLTVNTTLSVGG